MVEQQVNTVKPQVVQPMYIVVAVIILIVVSSSTFFIGMAVGSHHNTKSNATKVYGQNGQGFGGRSGAGGGSFRRGGARGQVTAVSSTSITIEESSGTSVTYAINSSTEVRSMGQSGASVSDITTGAEVMVIPVDASASSPVAATIMVMGANSNSNSTSNTSAGSS